MKDYFIGIDAGTDSCGIAATDTEYNLLRFKGKDMWAVSLFDEASSCEERRLFRGARRRIERRQQRVDLLQDVFADAVAEEDNAFFIRLNNSSLLLDDKADAAKQSYTLFNDDKFTDREFYKKYPTIYHLRLALMDENKKDKYDIRLYYLALHHIIKYRGHFLFEGQDIEQISNIAPVFEAINGFLSDNYENCAIIFDASKTTELYDAVLGKDWSVKNGSKFIETLFGLSSKQGKEFAKAIAGGKFDASILFDKEEYKANETYKYSFKEGTQESFEQFLTEYGDDGQLLQYLKSIYDWSVFTRMLKGKDSVSDAMTEQYEKHHKDLCGLKALVKKYMAQKDYDKIFRVADKDVKNYPAYSGINKIDGKKQYIKRCTKEDFYAFLKSELGKYANAMEGDVEYQRILGDIEKGEYMPRILDADNGVFPYQLNEYELNKICDNLIKDYPKFGEKGDDGFSAEEKIRKIFRFRIPYYVGPLSFDSNKKSNAWIIKKSDERVLPWNFEKVVDVDATAERFIRRMTNKCSYLKGCDVIPKQSLLYSRFMVLNQLNKLTINSVPVDVELKQKIFTELFLKEKKPTVKKLSKLLSIWGLVPKGEQIAFGGIDNDFTVNMSSYVTFDRIFGGEVDKYEKVIEDIILCHTLFNDKNDVENRILAKYADIPLVKENIKIIKGLNFKDFGTLSQEFLTGLSAEDETGDGELPVSIMDLLWCTNMNLMEIINDPRYKFDEKIRVHNGEASQIVKYEDLDEYYLNAMAKRGVWRAVTMIDEYVKAVGNPPKKFFIEVTRGDDKEKKRKDSRLAELKAAYNASKNYIEEYNKLINELNGKTESDLKQERLYLWFKQLGRCMYSGEKIDLDELSGNICDVDHIIPQSLKKDDSIHNNKVLVLRKYNKEKSDTYPLNSAWQSKNISFWKVLKSMNLINEEKYARLTRKEELTEDELNDFINRQLVITGQATKAIAEILQRKYPDSKVVYSKAGNVSDFRQKFDLLKNRNVNDLHHARDAYLNIVVGNVFDTRFGIFNNTRKLYYIDENGCKKKYSFLRIYDRNIVGAWDKKTTIDTVKRNYNKNSMAVVRMSKETRGGFYNQTVYRKGEGIIPIKQRGPMSDTEKYGGYKSSDTSYFMVVDSLDKKGRKMRSVEAMSIYHDRLIKTNQMTLSDYMTKILGLKEPEIVFEKIKNKALLSWNGTLVYISGITGKQLSFYNANQWYVDNDVSDYLRLVDKAMEDNSRLKDYNGDEVVLVIKSKISEKNRYVSKEENQKVYDLIKRQLGKDLYKGISAFGLIKSYLIKGDEKFRQLNIFEQCAVLKELVKFLQCKGMPANLTAIGESKRSGVLIQNSNITETNVALINRSPAGLYKNVVIINKPYK